MKQISLVLVAMLAMMTSFAQNDTTSNKMSFKLGINYHSSLHYFGRTDSLKSSGLFPMAEIWFTEELYINAAPVFVNNAMQRFDYAGSVTSIGYLKVSPSSVTNIYLLKPFYEKSSILVQSLLKAQGGASISFLNKVVNITAGADTKITDRIDFGATAGLDHIFKQPGKGNSVLVFNPSLYVYAGTQQFTRSASKNGTAFPLLPPQQEIVTQRIRQFNVLAYEASLPIIYVRGKWMAVLTPSFVSPQNLIRIEGRPDLSEQGRSMLYGTLGLKHSF